MKGLLIDGDEFKIVNGSRVVATTEGTLVCLLPTLYSWTTALGSAKTLTFPDGTKDLIYGWRGKDNRGFNPDPDEPDSHSQTNAGKVWFTRLPQEYEASQTLMAAPAGADIFFGFVRLTQTDSPSHTWAGVTLAPLQKTGAWIPWQGSGLMEATFGLARAMHLVIEGGNLVLVAEQTVGPACGGGNRTWGDWPASNIFNTGGDNEGGNFAPTTSVGLVVWTSASSPYTKSSNRVVNTDGNPSDFTTHQRTGVDPASTTDPTDYTSTYTVEVRGYFGRRS